VGAAEGEGADGQKTDDEILAEALGQFGRDPAGAGDAAAAAGDSAAAGAGTAAESTAAGADATAGSTAAGAGGGAALTDAEKAQLLNQELERRFAQFDELMRTEREAAVRQGNEGAGAGGGAGGMNGGGPGGEDEAPETAMSDSGRPAPAAAARGTGVPGTGSSDIAVAIPADIGSAYDDDIIARQLREAAMKEQDPVLREKLWNEYRRYKNGGS